MKPDAEAAGPAGQPRAAGNRHLLAVVAVRPMRRLKNSSMSSSGGLNRELRGWFRGDVAEVEDAGVLEEELALLREEQAELRQVDLLLVGFGLREVGIDGDVERQRRA